MSDALSLLLLPFAASIIFVLIHAYLGVHVLRRNVVFADLALAQLSALGATVAFANGFAPRSAAGYAYALLFTALGAALLTLTRGLARYVNREAFVGILYVVATAATVLVVDRSPQGAEHVKRILLGEILTVGPADVARLAALYAVIGLVCWLMQRPLLAASSDTEPPHQSAFAVSMWDLAFFVIFGIVVTSSVAIAGVLLVFSFLIIPPVIGLLFSTRLRVVLSLAWIAGIVASGVGLAASYGFDLPTGAAMVTAFAFALAVAGLVRVLLFANAAQRRFHRRIAARAVISAALMLTFASSLWLMLTPAADQPLLAAFETATGLAPSKFLTSGEQEVYESAARDMLRFQAEVDRLNAMEKTARHQGAPLADDEIRRIASYQQAFSEMTRGERFVQDVLRAKARAKERWIVGLPAAMIALLGLAFLTQPWWRTLHLKRQKIRMNC